MPAQYYCPQWYGTSNSTMTTQTLYYPQNWNTGTASTIYTTGSNQIWTRWNEQWVQTAITSTDMAWQRWINQSQVYTYQQTPTPLTPEQLQAQREASERYEMQRQERRQRQTAARARARVLLGEFLTDEQKAELERQGQFHVTGSKGRRYCIRASGQSGNVDLLKADGSVQATLCAHPTIVPGESELVPEADAWLMQMIEIRHDEDRFLRTANVHRGRLPVG